MYDLDHIASYVIRKIRDLKGDDRLDITNIRNGENLAIGAARPRFDMSDQRWHGGGDTVSAGSNITITDSNGTKIISASTSLAVLTATGTINDSNTVFGFASAPTLIAVNGLLYRSSGDSITWSYVGGNATLSEPVGTGGSIYALG